MVSKYLLTNVSDTQQVVEYGEPGDLETTVIIPAKARITLEIVEDVVKQLKLTLAQSISFRKL